MVGQRVILYLCHGMGQNQVSNASDTEKALASSFAEQLTKLKTGLQASLLISYLVTAHFQSCETQLSQHTV